jgi:type VI protein secretion system component Hcp
VLRNETLSAQTWKPQIWKAKDLEIKMEHVLITNFRQGGDNTFPVEHISFSHWIIVMTYSQQQRDGGNLSGNVVAGWDSMANKTTV